MKPDGFTRSASIRAEAVSRDGQGGPPAGVLPARLPAIRHPPTHDQHVASERFGIAEKNASTASRLLSEAVEAGLIEVEDPEAVLVFAATCPSGRLRQRSGRSCLMRHPLKNLVWGSVQAYQLYTDGFIANAVD